MDFDTPWTNDEYSMDSEINVGEAESPAIDPVIEEAMRIAQMEQASERVHEKNVELMKLADAKLPVILVLKDCRRCGANPPDMKQITLEDRIRYPQLQLVPFR